MSHFRIESANKKTVRKVNNTLSQANSRLNLLLEKSVNDTITFYKEKGGDLVTYGRFRIQLNKDLLKYESKLSKYLPQHRLITQSLKKAKLTNLANEISLKKYENAFIETKKNICSKILLEQEKIEREKCTNELIREEEEKNKLKKGEQKKKSKKLDQDSKGKIQDISIPQKSRPKKTYYSSPILIKRPKKETWDPSLYNHYLDRVNRWNREPSLEEIIRFTDYNKNGIPINSYASLNREQALKQLRYHCAYGLHKKITKGNLNKYYFKTDRGLAFIVKLKYKNTVESGIFYYGIDKKTHSIFHAKFKRIGKTQTFKESYKMPESNYISRKVKNRSSHKSKQGKRIKYLFAKLKNGNFKISYPSMNYSYEVERLIS